MPSFTSSPPKLQPSQPSGARSLALNAVRIATGRFDAPPPERYPTNRLSGTTLGRTTASFGPLIVARIVGKRNSSTRTD